MRIRSSSAPSAPSQSPARAASKVPATTATALATCCGTREANLIAGARVWRGRERCPRGAGGGVGRSAAPLEAAPGTLWGSWSSSETRPAAAEARYHFWSNSARTMP